MPPGQVGFSRYANKDKHTIKHVYYTGSDQLKAGYALCYDRDDTAAVNAADTALGATSSSWARHTYVEKPKNANLYDFAGVVAPQSASVTGPGWIKIIVPEGNVIDVYSDGSNTANTTFITVQPASYNFGVAGEGAIVGKALQTVDRSSTNGTVQAEMWGTDSSLRHYGAAVPSSTNNVFSPAIWATCPWPEIMDPRMPRQVGYGFFDDFTATGALISPTAAATAHLGHLGPYLAYCDIATGGIVPQDLAGGGGVKITLDGDNEEASIQPCGASYSIGSTALKKMWFEARLQTSTIANTKHGIYCGLMEGSSAVADVIADGGTIVVKDHIGFHRLEGDGDTMDTVHALAGGALATVKADALTLVADTDMNIGMVYDGVNTVTFYANGVALDDTVLHTATNFPDNQPLAPILAVKNATGTTPGTTTLKWWRVAQVF